MVIYGDCFITHNFYGLTLLIDDVDYFAPILDFFTLDLISTFPFENYLQIIKKMVRGINPWNKLENALLSHIQYNVH